MADNYIDKFADPAFQRDFESMSKQDQDEVLKSMGMSRATATLAPLGLPTTKHSPKREGLQPQIGEKNPNPLEDPMGQAAAGLTAGAAASMIPGGLAAAGLSRTVGIPALRALLAGATGTGLDAAFDGGKHPLLAGATAGLGELGLEIPGTRKLLGKALSTLMNRGETKAAEAGTGALRKQLSKFGGATNPGYIPPAKTVTPKVKPSERGDSLEAWIKRQKEKAVKGSK